MRFPRTLTIAVASLLVIVLPAVAKEGRPLSGEEEAAIRVAFDDLLPDGESARYKLGPLVDKDVYCGKVNFKNKFGAYVGYRYFSVQFTKSESVTAEITGLAGPKATMVTGMCNAFGY